MSKPNYISLILILISFNCYSQSEYQYQIFKRGEIESTTFHVIQNNLVDSNYIFTYQQVYENKLFDTTELVLPIANDTVDFIWFVNRKSIYYGSKTYEILKFKLDDPGSDDEEMFFFYCPDFGVLLQYSIPWGNHSRLFSISDPEKDRIILFLCERILIRHNFIDDWM